jgi:hypothetical protein
VLRANLLTLRIKPKKCQSLISSIFNLNLNNKTRLDALTPIINSLNLPTLHFLNETNVYRYEQIGFSLLHVKDKIENVIPAKFLFV